MHLNHTHWSTENGSCCDKGLACEERQRMKEDGEENECRRSDLRPLSSSEARREKGGRTLNRRGGTIGEREVKISFTAAMISRTIPTTSGAMVCGVDPESVVTTGRKVLMEASLTARLTEIESNQDTHHSAYNKKQA